MTNLLTAIVLWLSANFDLPATFDHPRIVRAPAATIGALHYRNVLPMQRPAPDGQPGGGTGTIVAAYDSTAGTIYLPEEWTGETPAELSVLVHEMVHHLQTMAGLTYECAQARERVAFFAQERWLRLYQSDLPAEFGIDPFTLLVRTTCAY